MDDIFTNQPSPVFPLSTKLKTIAPRARTRPAHWAMFTWRREEGADGKVVARRGAPVGKGRGGAIIGDPDHDRWVTLYFIFMGVFLGGAVLLTKISPLMHVSLG